VPAQIAAVPALNLLMAMPPRCLTQTRSLKIPPLSRSPRRSVDRRPGRFAQENLSHTDLSIEQRSRTDLGYGANGVPRYGDVSRAREAITRAIWPEPDVFLR
jgi:hypothetical protein